jgi:predicted DCC family thiol-disulfide oxidoreductase YuxK
MEDSKKIVFYDGDCGFCNKSVQFILKHERKKEIYFSALQSNFSKLFFENHKFPKADLSTFYFWDGEKLHQKSSGALKLLNSMKFPWSVLKIGYAIPLKLRDKMYDFIANRRHKLNSGCCLIPHKDERERFLND